MDVKMSASTKAAIVTDSSFKIEQSADLKTSAIHSDSRHTRINSASFASPSEIFEKINQVNQIFKNEINLFWLDNSKRSISRCKFLPKKYKNFLLNNKEGNRCKLEKKRKRLFTPTTNSRSRVNRFSMFSESRNDVKQKQLNSRNSDIKIVVNDEELFNQKKEGDTNDNEFNSFHIVKDDSSSKRDKCNTYHSNLLNSNQQRLQFKSQKEVPSAFLTKPKARDDILNKSKADVISHIGCMGHDKSRQRKLKNCSSSVAIIHSDKKICKLISKNEIKSRQKISPKLRSKITQDFRYKRIKKLTQNASKHFYGGELKISDLKISTANLN